MASPRMCFSVPTKDICVLCLQKVSPGSSSGGGGGGKQQKQYSFQPISTYLDLDVKSIFNIKSELVTEAGEEASGLDFEVEVTLCKSCVVLRNAFSDIYEELLKIQRKMNSCVRGIRDVMLKAENNVSTMKGYFNAVMGAKKQSLTAVRSSIPEKFRKEAIAKSSMKEFELCDESMDFKTCDTDAAAATDPDNKDDEVIDENTDEFEKEFLELEGETMTTHCADEEEDDLETLMMKYESASTVKKTNAKKRKRTHLSSFKSKRRVVSVTKKVENAEVYDEIDIAMEFDAKPDYDYDHADKAEPSNKIAGQTQSKPSPNNGSTTNKKTPRKIGRHGSYSGRFECEICGKVVVSLKNFELHQRRHAGEKPFECELCQKTFRDTSNLRSHVLRYHRQFLFVKYKNDNVTLEQFQKDLDTLILSVLLPSPNQASSTQMSHACQLCDRSYTQRYAIEDHIVQRHYDTIAVGIFHLQNQVESMTKAECVSFMLELQNEGKTARTCGLCGSAFESGEDLNNHVKTHVKVNLIRKQKDESGALPSTQASMSAFSSASAAQQRLITLKMKCEPCGLYFDDLSALNQHKTECANSNGNSALFKCEYCGKCLNTFHNHRRHLLSLHRFQVFAEHLPAGTKAVDMENVIRGIFLANKPVENGDGFKCFLCERYITQKRKLTSHVLATHFDQMVELIKEELQEGRANGFAGVNGNHINLANGDEDDVSIEIEEDDDEDGEIMGQGLPGLLSIFGGDGETPMYSEDSCDVERGDGQDYMFGISDHLGGMINGIKTKSKNTAFKMNFNGDSYD